MSKKLKFMMKYSTEDK